MKIWIFISLLNNGFNTAKSIDLGSIQKISENIKKMIRETEKLTFLASGFQIILPNITPVNNKTGISIN